MRSHALPFLIAYLEGLLDCGGIDEITGICDGPPSALIPENKELDEVCMWREISRGGAIINGAIEIWFCCRLEKLAYDLVKLTIDIPFQGVWGIGCSVRCNKRLGVGQLGPANCAWESYKIPDVDKTP
jgi:hypothetical protein